MKVAVAGTGYVGLVTGVALAHVGHNVTCVDVDEEKIKIMRKGISPIYEDGLEELMKKNKERLTYTTDYKSAYSDADVIFVGVGTPERSDGSANLDYIYAVCDNIIEAVAKDVVVVIKSTVPIGTNDNVEDYLRKGVKGKVKISVASNPEFLAQGTAVRDTLYASRIVVGTEDEFAREMLEEVYRPFTTDEYKVPYLSMNRRSSEMVKYASNDFLALKISYINEISNLCEAIGADITEVTRGMSYDKRIGDKFLNSGIGYGGSCFPKDTKALHFLSCINDSELKTVKAGIDVNKNQKLRLFRKLKEDYGIRNLKGLNVAILGASFKPGTDDLREAPSIDNVRALLDYGVNVSIFDPVALNNFEKIFGDNVTYYENIGDCIKDKDVALIMTEWPEIKEYDVNNYIKLMKKPVIYDGRNCYALSNVEKLKLNYISMGRKEIINLD